MMLTQDNHLYLCPAGKGNEKPLRRVLDAGCGTGVWSVDMGMPDGRIKVDSGCWLTVSCAGDEHPEASVRPSKLSPAHETMVLTFLRSLVST